MSEQVQYEDGSWSREVMPVWTVADFLLARIAEDEAAAPGVHEHCAEAMGRPCDCGWPARVLAECEAKRRIVEDITEADAEDTSADEKNNSTAEAGLRSLRHLAAVYADHPDYRKEWQL